MAAWGLVSGALALRILFVVELGTDCHSICIIMVAYKWMQNPMHGGSP